MSYTLEAEIEFDQLVTKVQRKLTALVSRYGEEGLIELCKDLSFIEPRLGNAAKGEMAEEIRATMRNREAKRVLKIHEARYGRPGLQELKVKINKKLE